VGVRQYDEEEEEIGQFRSLIGCFVLPTCVATFRN